MEVVLVGLGLARARASHRQHSVLDVDVDVVLVDSWQVGSHRDVRVVLLHIEARIPRAQCRRALTERRRPRCDARKELVHRSMEAAHLAPRIVSSEGKHLVVFVVCWANEEKGAGG